MNKKNSTTSTLTYISASILASSLLLSACSTVPFSRTRPPETANNTTPLPPVQTPPSTTKPNKPEPTINGYYSTDGPPESIPVNLDEVAEPIPQIEIISMSANKPYNVFGVDYIPETSISKPFRQRGIASWYGKKFHGKRTASGETYNMFAMTAAHPTLPLPSYARVTNPKNGKSIIVRVNDRGPFLHSRIMDLSYAAAHKLGYAGNGSAEVIVEKITAAEIQAMKNGQINQAAAPDQELENAKAFLKKTDAEQYTNQNQAMLKPVPNNNVKIAANGLPETTQQEKGTIFVQLGAFSNRDNAEKMRVNIYQKSPWLNLAININPSPENRFKLHLGPFKDRAEALNTAQKIQESLNIKGVIVQK